MFEKESSLTFNLNKSCFITSSSIPLRRINKIMTITGFNNQMLPITYFKTPIYKAKKKIFLFNMLISNITKKIASWEHHFFSLGGIITLITSVLNSIPF